jgi:hypothetical protein
MGPCIPFEILSLYSSSSFFPCVKVSSVKIAAKITQLFKKFNIVIPFPSNETCWIDWQSKGHIEKY